MFPLLLRTDLSVREIKADEAKAGGKGGGGGELDKGQSSSPEKTRVKDLLPNSKAGFAAKKAVGAFPSKCACLVVQKVLQLPGNNYPTWRRRNFMKKGKGGKTRT